MRSPELCSRLTLSVVNEDSGDPLVLGGAVFAKPWPLIRLAINPAIFFGCACVRLGDALMFPRYCLHFRATSTLQCALLLM
jgi:hypothetical protein